MTNTNKPIVLVILCSAFLFIFCANSFAQVELKLKGKIINKATGEPVPFAITTLPSSMQSLASDEDGYFKLIVQRTDTLVISSVGYKRAIYPVPKAFSADSVYSFYLEQVRTSLDEVVVRGKKFNPTWSSQLGTGKVSETSPELRQVRGSIISALSTENKRKREFAKEINQTDERQAIAKVYNEEFIQQITGLEDDLLEKFLMYLNSEYPLSSTDNEYAIRVTVADAYPKFIEHIKEQKDLQ